MSVTRISILMMRPPRAKPTPILKVGNVAPPSPIKSSSVETPVPTSVLAPVETPVEVSVETPVLAKVEPPIGVKTPEGTPDLAEAVPAPPSAIPNAPVDLTRAILAEKTKATLVKFAADIGLELDPSLKKADMISRLAAALGI